MTRGKHARSTLHKANEELAERWTALWESEWKQDLFARALEHLKTLVPGKLGVQPKPPAEGGGAGLPTRTTAHDGASSVSIWWFRSRGSRQGG